jgi:DNA-directed RNA polymerase specialized sigma24 family protein
MLLAVTIVHPLAEISRTAPKPRKGQTHRDAPEMPATSSRCRRLDRSPQTRNPPPLPTRRLSQEIAQRATLDTTRGSDFVTAIEALAVARLCEWAHDRNACRQGRIAVYKARGFVDRSREADARLVRAIVFERAFATLPDTHQTTLLLAYRDGCRPHRLAHLLHTNPSQAQLWLVLARKALADALDRRQLL